MESAGYARQGPQDGGKVLARHDPEHELDRPPGVELAQRSREDLRPVRVVSDVEKHTVDLLESARPARGRETARHRVGGHR